MTENITLDFIKSHSLMDCLREFDGAHSTEKENKEKELDKVFYLLAQKMLYGGYIRVRNDYAVFISKVELYYHEEADVAGERVLDDIVYHRNDNFVGYTVPYFPIMTLHSHWSGFDIAFEKESGHYRASALIRKYVVLDLKTGNYLRLDTSCRYGNLSIENKKNAIGAISPSNDPYVDNRSTYLQYYLNGFTLGGSHSNVEWQDIDLGDYHVVNNEYRKNANQHDWGYIYANKELYFEAIQKTRKMLLTNFG